MPRRATKARRPAKPRVPLPRQTGGVRYITESELLEDVYTMNDFVLGDDYKKAAAKLHPVSKEYVHTLMWPQRRTDSSQRESTPQERV